MAIERRRTQRMFGEEKKTAFSAGGISTLFDKSEEDTGETVKLKEEPEEVSGCGT